MLHGYRTNHFFPFPNEISETLSTATVCPHSMSTYSLGSWEVGYRQLDTQKQLMCFSLEILCTVIWQTKLWLTAVYTWKIFLILNFLTGLEFCSDIHLEVYLYRYTLIPVLSIHTCILDTCIYVCIYIQWVHSCCPPNRTWRLGSRNFLTIVQMTSHTPRYTYRFTHSPHTHPSYTLHSHIPCCSCLLYRSECHDHPLIPEYLSQWLKGEPVSLICRLLRHKKSSAEG